MVESPRCTSCRKVKKLANFVSNKNSLYVRFLMIPQYFSKQKQSKGFVIICRLLPHSLQTNLSKTKRPQTNGKLKKFLFKLTSAKCRHGTWNIKALSWLWNSFDIHEHALEPIQMFECIMLEFLLLPITLPWTDQLTGIAIGNWHCIVQRLTTQFHFELHAILT